MGCCSSAALSAADNEAPHGAPAGDRPTLEDIDASSAAEDRGDAENAGKAHAPSDGRSPETHESLGGASTAGASVAASGGASSSRRPSGSEATAAEPTKRPSGLSEQGPVRDVSGFSDFVETANSVGAGILSRITVRPYGVLGAQRLKRTGRIEDKGGPPGPDVVIMDPAGLTYILEGPAKAGAASGAIYEWLGIRKDPSFPEDVLQTINQPRTAKLHVYGEKACIHCVGPNFTQADAGVSYEWALAELADAYRAALRELAASGFRRCRLLPLSSGNFAGKFIYELPQLTSQALQQAFSELDSEQRALLMDAELDLCIYLEKELPEYEAAFKL